jgi:radical SAM protein with 4Fe4S-binding SPASM domain
LRFNAGSHPLLYKIGMRLYRINPKLWYYGIIILNLPNKIKRNRKRKGYWAGKIETINLEPTVVCNLKCKMCWWWGENGVGYDLIKNKDTMITNQLTKDEIFHLVDSVSDIKPSFYLSGGEQFTRKDTIETIEYIANKGMPIIMTDNGTMIDEPTLKRLSKIRRLTINFSLDGPKDVHDDIRGEGKYEITTKTIKRLIELRGKEIMPAIKITTTLSPMIVGRLDEFIKEVDSFNVDAIRMQHLWFTDKAHVVHHQQVLQQLFGISDDQGAYSHVIPTPQLKYVDTLAKEICKIEHTKYKTPVFIWPKMNYNEIVKYYSDLDFVKVDACSAPWSIASVRANGDVMFCPDEWITKHKIGNIRETDIKDLWNNDKARFFREQLEKTRLFPCCTRCCYVSGPNATDM